MRTVPEGCEGEEDARRRIFKALQWVATAERLRRQARSGLIPRARAARDVAAYMKAARAGVQDIVRLRPRCTPMAAGALLERHVREIPELAEDFDPEDYC